MPCAGAATTSGTDAAWYLDTSAAAKLVVDEAHSPALRAWATEHADDLVSSDLLRAELLRATRRTAIDESDAPGEGLVLQTQAVIDAVDLVPIPRHVYRDAGLLDPPHMRTLDALHLAIALSLGDDLDGLVTYDSRMADAARRHGVTVIGPT
ncbi:MAG TPA: type II toxin-antitoxin system VapC family toxin [Miltoncostaeaceae bacterium]|jgi:predicted nucleic acid-binding protein|nr:type II toxin-antitoxin system VapC family toxin [Miltoncostaeaceae bacterium]